MRGPHTLPVWRHYATISPGRYFGRKPTLSLEQFLQRQKVLELWRDIHRVLKTIPPQSSTRQELRQFARDEFQRHRNVTDLAHIRYLLSTGKTQFDSMKRYIDMQIGGGG